MNMYKLYMLILIFEKLIYYYIYVYNIYIMIFVIYI